MIIKNFYNKNQRGLSLIEMMVVVVILGLIVLGLVTFFTGGTKSWVAGQSQLKAQREARQAMDRMVRELRHSESIDNCGNGQVKVKIPDLNGADDSPGFYHVTYDWRNKDSVWRKKNIGENITENIIIGDVLYLEFNCSDPPTESSKINILLEMDVDHDGHADISLNTEVNLRNFGLQE